jgi:transcriptional adapter 2-alpha
MRISTLSSGEKYESEKAARLAKHTQAASQFERSLSSLGAGAGSRQKPKELPETATAVVEYTTKDLPVRLSPDTRAGAKNLPTPPLSDTSFPTMNGNGNAITTSPPKRAPLASIPNLTPARWDEDNAPSLQLLEPAEIELCSKLRIQPKAYMAIKDRILAEAMKNEGKLKKKQVRELAKVDTTKGGRIFEFMVDSGWIGNGAR